MNYISLIGYGIVISGMILLVASSINYLHINYFWIILCLIIGGKTMDKNRTLLQKFIRVIKRNMIEGYDDFRSCLCIDIHTFDKLVEKYLELEKHEKTKTSN